MTVQNGKFTIRDVRSWRGGLGRLIQSDAEYGMLSLACFYLEMYVLPGTDVQRLVGDIQGRDLLQQTLLTYFAKHQEYRAQTVSDLDGRLGHLQQELEDRTNRGKLS